MSGYVQTLQFMRPFTVYMLTATDELEVYMHISGDTIIPALVLDEHDLGGQLERSAAEVGWWSRLAAQCDRVVQAKERRYAAWKAKLRLENAGVVLESTGKKPTVAQLDDLYRMHEDYHAIGRTLEEVREALKSCEGIRNAFEAKRELLQKTIWRGMDGTLGGSAI